MPPHPPLSCSIDARSSIVVGEPRGGLLAPAKDQRTAPLLLTLVCCRFRDRSTGPVGGCGASTGGWNSGRRQQERAPGRVPWLLAAGCWRRAQRGARAVRSRRRSALASRPADMMRRGVPKESCQVAAEERHQLSFPAPLQPPTHARKQNRRSMLHFRRCYEGVEGVQKVSLTKPTGGISPQPWCRPP